MFQCSSASRKFLNCRVYFDARTLRDVSVLFSEPKIPQFFSTQRTMVNYLRFQCSSASRKFLNSGLESLNSPVSGCFSALQRAENSSIFFAVYPSHAPRESFSALQRAENSSIYNLLAYRILWIRVSVLFSEPKIPQFIHKICD